MPQGKRPAIRILLALFAALLALPLAQQSEAQTAKSKRSWAEEKCWRYKRDFSEALRRWGTDGVSREFIEGNKAFIDSGCESEKKVCPKLPRELELVDVLTIRVVNEGMSSTFLPFACRN